MQFRLRTLIAVTAAVAGLCGIVFATPPILAAPLLCAMLWMSPSVWVTGAIYSQRVWRAFFIGGIVAGIVPFLFGVYYSINIAYSFLVGSDTAAVYDLATHWERWPNLLTSFVLLGPNLFAFLGGLLSAITYRCCKQSSIDQ